MPAFWIAHVNVTNSKQYQKYIELAPIAIKAYKGEILARGGEYETLEGEQFERHVVIQFPNLKMAKACYNSPEYLKARNARSGACIASISIVEGL